MVGNDVEHCTLGLTEAAQEHSIIIGASAKGQDGVEYGDVAIGLAELGGYAGVDLGHLGIQGFIRNPLPKCVMIIIVWRDRLQQCCQLSYKLLSVISFIVIIGKK